MFQFYSSASGLSWIFSLSKSTISSSESLLSSEAFVNQFKKSLVLLNDVIQNFSIVAFQFFVDFEVLQYCDLSIAVNEMYDGSSMF